MLKKIKSHISNFFNKGHERSVLAKKNIDLFNKLWSDDLYMVVSAWSNANPYFNLFEEQSNGFLKKLKEETLTCRQDIPKIWEYNGRFFL